MTVYVTMSREGKETSSAAMMFNMPPPASTTARSHAVWVPEALNRCSTFTQMIRRTQLNPPHIMARRADGRSWCMRPGALCIWTTVQVATKFAARCEAG